MKKILKRFSLIDYIIIILVICAVIFAFIHITTDDSTDLQKTAFDASTINKIGDTYSNYYKDGYIVKTTVDGFNASTGEEITLNGTVKWIWDYGGTNVGILIDSDNSTYLAGLYKTVPQADIYINTISLENDGSKYDNLVEVTIKPKKITSLSELTDIPKNTDYELSTVVSLDSIDSVKIQDMTNKLKEHGKRSSITTSDNGQGDQLTLSKSTKQNIDDADSILGNINGVTDNIVIRIYNCSDDQLNSIKDNFEVVNIRNF